MTSRTRRIAIFSIFNIKIEPITIKNGCHLRNTSFMRIIWTWGFCFRHCCPVWINSINVNSRIDRRCLWLNCIAIHLLNLSRTDSSSSKAKCKVQTMEKADWNSKLYCVWACIIAMRFIHYCCLCIGNITPLCIFYNCAAIPGVYRKCTILPILAICICKLKTIFIACKSIIPLCACTACITEI